MLRCATASSSTSLASNDLLTIGYVRAESHQNGQPLLAKKDVQGLYNAVKQPRGLSPERSDIEPLIANDGRQILSGLATVIGGVGALRTHGGDAHGREKGYARVDARIARLSIHAASTAALFLIETWQRKYPARPLPKAGDPEG